MKINVLIYRFFQRGFWKLYITPFYALILIFVLFFSRGTFARNAVLRLLNLSHNKIRRLDANSFRGMRFLR